MTTPRVAVVVPAAPGLLPSRGAADPFAQVRQVAVDTLRDSLPDADGVAVLGATDVARSLLEQAGFTGAVAAGETAPLLVVAADGSARRGEKAPGHLDPRAFDFDEGVRKALDEGEAATLRGLDLDLALELLALGAPALRRLGELLPEPRSAELLYHDDPFGVAYWVARWTT
ncbi:MAG: hypothetical protein ACRDPH_12330 [Marmoricola sp.]